MGAQGRDVGQNLGLAFRHQDEGARKMLLMELLGFFAQKGFERGECLAAQAQRVAAVTRGQFAQLETPGSVFALEGFAGRLELDPDRAIPCEGDGELAAIACG
ncbi:hypothetical protein [Delftia deserti]|uniref:Uncharacterized protein n=1 Tax=Delftia deserti TaxID=1651218 RepID=A0ABW5EZU1_9BURK